MVLFLSREVGSSPWGAYTLMEVSKSNFNEKMTSFEKRPDSEFLSRFLVRKDNSYSESKLAQNIYNVSPIVYLALP